MRARAKVIRGGESYEGKQSTAGLTYAPGVSAETVGSQRLWLGRAVAAPGGRTKAHVHERHDTGILVLEGEAHLYTGEYLGEHDIARAGDYIFIPANCPHVAVNRGERPLIAVLARTDPHEQESVVLKPELEGRVPS